MYLPTKAQIDAASRHAISIAGTAIVIFGLQSKGITLEGATSVINALGGTVSSVVTLLAALAPVYALLKASHSASPASQVASVQAIATGPASAVAADAQQALISATSAVAQDKSIPASQKAVDTLVAATIALPNVQTIITDKTTADNSSSPSVVPAPLARVS